MTAKESRKIDRCINIIEKCVNLGPPWDQAAWEALRDDLDEEIRACQARIAELKRFRKTAQRNIDELRPFPQKLMERLLA
jgi:hypothetical protein